MNPRQIPEAITTIRRLPVDKAWLSNYTETELEAVVRDVVNTTSYDRYSIISDDTIPTIAAFHEVLCIHDQHSNAVACGWVNIDASCGLSTYQPTPFSADVNWPRRDAYNFTPLATAHAMHNTQRTYFHAMTFATMSRDHWLRFPFGTYSGSASDLHQCVRLQEAGVPIYTSAAAYVYHAKEVRDRVDTAPQKRLLIGEREACVTMETWVGN
jgi:hypothetical protein